MSIYGLELAHHGIKGQKWGKRNGPPYPLKPEDRSATEKKEQKSSSSKEESKKQSNKSTKIETSKKSYNFSYGSGETTRHKITSGSNKGDQNIDKYAEEEDYDSADKFDGIGASALEVYMNKGKEAAAEYLDKNLKTKYEYIINDDMFTDNEYGPEKYVTFWMKVYGNNYVYGTAGEIDYTDEQYFEKLKKG